MNDTTWPPGIEPEVPIPGYPNTWTHTPAQAPIPRPPGLTEFSAPLSLERKLKPGSANLAEPVAGKPAIGQLMTIAG